MEWRTIVTGSGPVSHAFDDVAASVCGMYSRRDTRARSAGERYCQRCKHLLSAPKRLAKAAQGRLPL